MRLEKTAQVVIGAQFGDEGKGRLIDYQAASVGQDGLVVRFNGGTSSATLAAARLPELLLSCRGSSSPTRSFFSRS